MAHARRSFVIWGGGGHGKVVADLVRALGQDVFGYVDRESSRLGQIAEPGGGRVLLTEESLLAAINEPGRHPTEFDAVAIAVGNNAQRQVCARQIVGYDLPPLVHPTAVCSPSATFGRGTVVFPLAVVNAGASVGEAVIVNSGAIIEHDCVLEDAVHVSPGATMGGGVRVAERSWIGAGATIVQGISIGRDVIVGAGAVIIRDVPDGVTIVGNPGRVLGDEIGRRNQRS
ncbi:MAG: acetyltransferase [Gemmatimonadaceae bacterium]